MRQDQLECLPLAGNGWVLPNKAIPIYGSVLGFSDSARQARHEAWAWPGLGGYVMGRAWFEGVTDAIRGEGYERTQRWV